MIEIDPYSLEKIFPNQADLPICILIQLHPLLDNKTSGATLRSLLMFLYSLFKFKAFIDQICFRIGLFKFVG